MIEVIPISCTVVNWNHYLLTAKQILQRSISVSSDAMGMTNESLARYLVTLSELLDHPGEILKGESTLLRHASFGFLVICDDDTLIEVMESTDLSIHSIICNDQRHRVRLAVITGDLLEWRDAVIHSNRYDSGLRLLLNKCQQTFESQGLYQFWANYSKSHHKDGTFLLEKK